MSLYLRTLGIRVGFAILWFLSLLPYSALMFIGRRFGDVMRLLVPGRRKIARINLELCFPDKSDSEINNLLIQHFRALGMAFMELGICWWWSDEKLNSLMNIEGIENIEKYQEEGNGIILLSAHFTTLEIGGRLLALRHKVDAVYRKHQTPYVEKFIKNKRAKYSNTVIEKNNIRGMIKSLRKNQTVWYAPDQNFTGKNSVLAHFFKQPAPSNAATARLAKMTSAPVVPFVQYRRKDGKGYNLRVLPAIKDFPSGDDIADANRINEIFEEFITLQPSHYYWVHRRFKNLPENMPDIYQTDKLR